VSHLTAAELTELRSAYQAALAKLTPPSPSARGVLDEIIEHPRFPGVSDPPILSLLGTFIRTTQPRRVLEIGTYIGLSTVFIADILNTNEARGHLWTVDPDTTAHELAEPWAERAGVRDVVSFVVGFSTEPTVASALRAAGPFQFVYVDSSHSYEGTLAELHLIFEDWWLDRAGLLMLHDASDFARRWDPTAKGGVRRALDEWFIPRRDAYQMMILEPPLWPSAAGVAIVTRRRTADL
jgi:predicted O-methyltransferase YrrM